MCGGRNKLTYFCRIYIKYVCMNRYINFAVIFPSWIDKSIQLFVLPRYTFFFGSNPEFVIVERVIVMSSISLSSIGSLSISWADRDWQIAIFHYGLGVSISRQMNIYCNPSPSYFGWSALSEILFHSYVCIWKYFIYRYEWNKRFSPVGLL